MDYTFSTINDKEFELLVEENLRKQEEREEDYDDYYREAAYEEQEEGNAIEDLFSKSE